MATRRRMNEWIGVVVSDLCDILCGKEIREIIIIIRIKSIIQFIDYLDWNSLEWSDSHVHSFEWVNDLWTIFTCTRNCAKEVVVLVMGFCWLKYVVYDYPVRVMCFSRIHCMVVNVKKKFSWRRKTVLKEEESWKRWSVSIFHTQTIRWFGLWSTPELVMQFRWRWRTALNYVQQEAKRRMRIAHWDQ